MPASRPLQPDHQPNKTTPSTVTAPKKPSPLAPDDHQQPLHSVVSSPQNSPKSSHLNRFGSNLSSVSAVHYDANANLSTHASYTAIEGSQHSGDNGRDATECVSVDPNAARSSTSGHLFSDDGIVAMPGTQSHGRHASQAIALTEARLFAQQLHHQQPHQGQPQDTFRRISMVGTGPRSVVAASTSGRGSTAASTAASIVGIGGVGGTSPVLSGGDESTEHTLLLVRPTWVLDQDAAACQICVRTFNAVRRKVMLISISFMRLRSAAIGVALVILPAFPLTLHPDPHAPLGSEMACCCWYTAQWS